MSNGYPLSPLLGSGLTGRVTSRLEYCCNDHCCKPTRPHALVDIILSLYRCSLHPTISKGLGDTLGEVEGFNGRNRARPGRSDCANPPPCSDEKFHTCAAMKSYQRRGYSPTKLTTDRASGETKSVVQSGVRWDMPACETAA